MTIEQRLENCEKQIQELADRADQDRASVNKTIGEFVNALNREFDRAGIPIVVSVSFVLKSHQ